MRRVLPVAFTNPVAIDADGDGLTVFSDWGEERVRWTEPPIDADAGLDDAGVIDEWGPATAIDADTTDATRDR